VDEGPALVSILRQGENLIASAPGRIGDQVAVAAPKSNTSTCHTGNPVSLSRACTRWSFDDLSKSSSAVTSPTTETVREHSTALAAGRPVDSPVDSVAASALGATRIGDLPFAILQRHNVQSVIVSDGEILAARDLLWDEFRVAAEPAAAAPFAAWLADRVPGRLPCVIICGANTDWFPDPPNGQDR
jgi:Pyridoxal-phosphate dependent enzyme